MGTSTFCAIMCNVLRHTRIRLVNDIKWNIRSSFCSELCKNKLKSQLIGYPKAFNLLPTVSLYTWQANNLKMPKYKLENRSDNKTKEKMNAHSKNMVLKNRKKKKEKKKHDHKHRHKKGHSKKHSSKSKLSMAKKVELVLLDLSSDADSDILILYDSRETLKNVKSHGNDAQVLNNRKGDKETSGIKSLGNATEKKGETICDVQMKEYVGEAVDDFLMLEKSHYNCNLPESGTQSSNVNAESTSKMFLGSISKTEQDISGPACAVVTAKRSSCGSDEKRNRNWQYTMFGEKMTGSNKDKSTCSRPYMMFDVLSYNVLCQEIMEEHLELYTYNDPSALDWNYRSQLLMKEFIEFNSDVLCLQEVQQSHLKSFYRKLEDIGYTGLFKQRTGDKNDGVAIYYKTSTFDLIDYTTVEYFQPNVSVLNRDNVGLIVKLAPKAKPDERIIVATTHLLYNPRRHDVKLAQLQLLLAEVERFAFKEIDKRNNLTKYWPVILTGDMNMEPHTGGYELLSTGCFQYEGLSNKTLTPDCNGYGRTLGKELIPVYLGVTDYCQHLNIVKNRHQQSSTYSKSPIEDHRSEEPLLRIHNSDFKRRSKPVWEDSTIDLQNFLKNPNPKNKFGSGQICHDLQLSSVYQHNPMSYNKSQVSTFQSGWVVVDYIFYSNDGRCDVTRSHEGNLKLVARYKLLNEQEASNAGPIPNLSSPSDHYPLAAKFALLW